MKNRNTTSGGFSLIETLIAISLLSIAIVAPMTLASKGLSTAYYARDQITAFYLAQEAIEALRSIRDAQVLKITQGESGIDILGQIPITTATQDNSFTIDARKPDPALAITRCLDYPGQVCPPLQTNIGSDLPLYGYESGWDETYFTRIVRATVVSADAGGVPQEIRVSVTVSWRTGSIQTRTFSISANLYRWANDDSAQ